MNAESKKVIGAAAAAIVLVLVGSWLYEASNDGKPVDFTVGSYVLYEFEDSSESEPIDYRIFLIVDEIVDDTVYVSYASDLGELYYGSGLEFSVEGFIDIVSLDTSAMSKHGHERYTIMDGSSYNVAVYENDEERALMCGKFCLSYQYMSMERTVLASNFIGGVNDVIDPYKIAEPIINGDYYTWYSLTMTDDVMLTAETVYSWADGTVTATSEYTDLNTGESYTSVTTETMSAEKFANGALVDDISEYSIYIAYETELEDGTKLVGLYVVDDEDKSMVMFDVRTGLLLDDFYMSDDVLTSMTLEDISFIE